MAYWGQKDLIPQILVDYGNRLGIPMTASYFVEGKPQTVVVPAEFSGSGRTSQTFLVRVCQDFYNESSVQQNPDFGPFGGQFLGPYMMTQPYFCSTTSKDGLSQFGPIEAWYLDIKNNTGADGYISYTLYMQYIDKDGNFASASVTYPNTVRILTQTYPMNVQPLRRVAGVQPWLVTPIQKYSGNVTPYPYKDLPVNYRITTNAVFGGLYHITGSAGIDTNIGSGFNTIAGTINIASFNIPELEAASGQLNPISINSVISASNYNVKKCSDNTTASVSLTIGSQLYASGSVIYLTGSNAISGCYGVTAKITSSVQYENLTPFNSYPNCSWCQNDVKFYYVSLNGGGSIGSGQSLSYVDFNGTSRTLSLSTFGNTFKFLAANGSISTTYGGTTTITELSPNPTTNVNYSVSAGGGDSTSRIHTYQSTTGEVQLIYTSGDYATSSFCAVSSSLIQSWPTNGTYPYSIVTGSAC